MKSTVTSRKMLNPLIGIIRFSGELDFVPGQFCSIIFTKDGKEMKRPFSMSNLPGEEIEFYVKGYKDGEVTKHLLQLKEGDEVELKGPYGSFQLQDSDSEVYLICAGSGVSPIMSMAKVLKDSGRKVTVIQGVSYTEDLGWEKEFAEMDLTYVPTVSRPEEDSDWKGKTGRVEEHFDILTNTDAEVYVCGPPPMVDNCMNLLEGKGFSKIFKEKYY